MLKKFCTFTCLFLSFGANAAIVSLDSSFGVDTITRDTDTGLEWLDLTVTMNRTYQDVSAAFGAGQEFEGWRYASYSEVSSLLDASGGDSNFYESGWSVENNGLFDNLAPFWGDLHCESEGCPTGPGDGFTQFMYGEESGGDVALGYLYDRHTDAMTTTHDYIDLTLSNIGITESDNIIGSALVRTSVVPVPPAVWLFGSALLGLAGMARRT